MKFYYRRMPIKKKSQQRKRKLPAPLAKAIKSLETPKPRKAKETRMTDTQRLSASNVVAPLAATTIMRQSGSAKASRPYCIARREFIADVLGTTTSRIDNYQINPGLRIFPWLAGIARAYDLYRFTRFRIEYVTHDSSQDKGKMVMAFDPNPDDPIPATVARLENFETRAVNTPWANNFVDVPASDLNRLPKFMIRDSLVPSTLTTYDIGSLSVGVAGTLDSALVGEIWFDYEVCFWSPQPLEDLTTIPQAESTSAYQQPTVPLITATDYVIAWSSVVTNPLRLMPTLGVFTDLRGALRVTAEISISWAGGAPTAGTSLVAIQLSTNGGTSYSDVATAYYGFSATVGVESKTVSAILLLIPSYRFRVRVVSTFAGTAFIAVPTGANNLFITPA